MSPSPQVRIVWPPLTPHVIAIAATLFAVRMVMVVAAPVKVMAVDMLVLNAQTLTSLQLWAILSHVLFSLDFGSLFFDLLGLYMFGGELQQRWGKRKWYGAIGLAALLGGLFAALSLWLSPSHLMIGGFGAPVMAFVAGYCREHWEKRLNFFFVELQGKMLLGFFVGLDVLVALLNASPHMFALHLGGLLAGLLIADDLYKPKRLMLHFKYWKIKRNLRVVAKTPEADGKHKQRRDDGQWIN